MIGLHTTKTYKVEYGSPAIVGWVEIQKFISFLREKMEEGEDIFIDEEETQIEISFEYLNSLRSDDKWGKIANIIWEESDHSNNEAHLDIW